LFPILTLNSFCFIFYFLAGAEVDQISDRIKAGIARRTTSEDKLRDSFAKCREEQPEEIPLTKLKDALIDLGIQPENVEHFARQARTQCTNKTIDFDAFKRIALGPSVLESWTTSLPLAALLADSLPLPPSQDEDPVRNITTLSASQIECISDAFSKALSTMLTEHVKRLKEAYDGMDKPKESNSNLAKFQVVDMSSGVIEDFHKGFQHRIGKKTASTSTVLCLPVCFFRVLPSQIFRGDEGRTLQPPWP